MRHIAKTQVSTVINFDIPKDIHTYLHRIGRSGRWGRKGVGINFLTRRDVGKLKEIETYYACEIKEMPANLEFIQKSLVKSNKNQIINLGAGFDSSYFRLKEKNLLSNTLYIEVIYQFWFS